MVYSAFRWARFGIRPIFLESANMAPPATAYVNEGPNVQYDAQAMKECQLHHLIKSISWNIPNIGPRARPSCPDERNFPKALPFASSGTSTMALPVIASTVSSHCTDAYAVSEFTTVALVKARQTAAACKMRTAMWEEAPFASWGTTARRKRATVQLATPRRAISPWPTFSIERRT